MRRTVSIVTAAATAAAIGALAPATQSVAGSSIPTLKLVTVIHRGTLQLFPVDKHRTVGTLSLGVYLTAVGGPFEVDAHRHGHGVRAVQVLRHGNRVQVVRRLPHDPGTSLADGLGHFLTLTWVDSTGTVAAVQQLPWCPSTSQYGGGRLNGSGPMLPTFPEFCGGSRLTRASVWGVDEGWAAPLFPNTIPTPGITDGSYTLELSVNREWANALHLAGPTSTSVTVRVRSGGGGCGPKCCPGAGACCVDICPVAGPEASVAGTTSTPRAGKLPETPPGPAPDLNPLRPRDIKLQINQHSGQQLLTFAATVWDRGRGPLLVDGYRHGSRPVMQARQYFLSGNHVVASRPVGYLHFDPRRGHDHWHFEDFAAYDLYSPGTGTDVRSHKQSFCIAPTDAINLTLPAAEWQPDQTGLASACGYGERGAIWMRETLPVGWGDTYYQSVAGQAIDVTKVPNGVYELRVRVNPHHRLVETNYRNDLAFTRVRLGGSGSSRTVTVLTSK